MRDTSNGRHSVLYARFTKAERAHKRSLLVSLLKNGKKLKSFSFQIVYLSQASLKNNFLRTATAITVPKKVCKKAVERNRTKRIYRHAWQSLKFYVEEHIPAGASLLLWFRVNTRAESFFSVREEMEAALKRILLDSFYARS